MARMGQFAGPSEQYGLPLSYIHPKDNDFAKAKFNPILLDPRWKLTDQQRRELQEKADDLADLMALGSELPLDRQAGNGKRRRSSSSRR